MTEIDLDDRFCFSDIRCLSVFQDHFYIMANKLKNKTGVYVLRIPFNVNDVKSENEADEIKFVYRCRYGLRIDDANIDFKDISSEDNPCQADIVISYKIVYENIFNVIVMRKMDD